jgi:hypothetical protein
MMIERSTPMIAIAPLGVMVVFAGLLFVVGAIICGRGRAALAALAVFLGFGAVALAGGLLLMGLCFGTTRVEVAEVPIHEELVRTVTEPVPVPQTPESGAPESGTQLLAEAEAPLVSDEAAAAARLVDSQPLAEKRTAARPQWMDEPQGKHGDGEYRKIASVEFYHSRAECEEALPDELRKAVEKYIDQFLGEEGAGKRVAMPMHDIHDRVVRDEWEEHTVGTYGTVVNLHKLLVFDRRVNEEIKERYRNARVAGRLTTTGVGAGLLLGFLGTVFGYLKLDTFTRGYYARRLQLAAGAAILVEAAAAALLAQGKFGF